MEAENLNVSASNSSGQLTEYSFAQTPVLAGILATHEVVAVKPLCENLGIDYSWQWRQIQTSPVLSQLLLKEKVYTQGKRREMVCFGFAGLQEWLWSINTTDNLNVELLNEYRKGLVWYLIQALGITLAEVVRQRELIETLQYDQSILKSKVRQMIETDETGKEHARKAKESFRMEKEIRAEVWALIDGGQLTLQFEVQS